MKQEEDGDGLRSYSQERGLRIREAGPFKPGEAFTKLGDGTQFVDIAFTLPEGEVSSAFQAGDDFIVLQVTEKMPPQVPPLKEVQNEVWNDLASVRTKEMAASTAQAILAALKKGGGFETLLLENSLTIEESGFFKRSASSVPGIDYFGDRMSDIVSLNFKDPWLQDVIEITNASVVMKLQDVRKAVKETFESEKETYSQSLNDQQKKALLEQCIEALKLSIGVEEKQNQKSS